MVFDFFSYIFAIGASGVFFGLAGSIAFHIFRFLTGVPRRRRDWVDEKRLSA